MDYLHTWFDPNQYHEDSIGRLILLTGATGLVTQYTSFLTNIKSYLVNVEDILEESIQEGTGYLETIADGVPEMAMEIIEEMVEGTPISVKQVEKTGFTGILANEYHKHVDLVLWFALLVVLCTLYFLVVKKF